MRCVRVQLLFSYGRQQNDIPDCHPLLLSPSQSLPHSLFLSPSSLSLSLPHSIPKRLAAGRRRGMGEEGWDGEARRDREGRGRCWDGGWSSAREMNKPKCGRSVQQRKMNARATPERKKARGDRRRRIPPGDRRGRAAERERGGKIIISCLIN